MLVAAHEQMRMVLNVTVRRFCNGVDDKQKLGCSNPKWLERATPLMASIAPRYAAAETGLNELYAVRDARMNDHGIPLRMPAMGRRKRPASRSAEWPAPLTRARTKTLPSAGDADVGEGTEDEDAGAKKSEAEGSEVGDGETLDEELGGVGLATERGDIQPGEEKPSSIETQRATRPRAPAATRGAVVQTLKLAAMKRPTAEAHRASAGAEATGHAASNAVPSPAMSATVRQSSSNHGHELPTSQCVRGAALEQFV